MNSNLTLGILAFLAWSCFSIWYYVCEIKGLCYETALSTEKAEESSSRLATFSETPKPDTAVAVIEKPILQTINITEEKIYFNINSVDFLNPAYVEDFAQNLKAKIEGRDIEINIIGSTCDLGKADYNQKLGLQRAKTMLQFLNNNEITSSKIEVSSQGEISSINGTKEERQKNRKVLVTIKSTD